MPAIVSSLKAKEIDVVVESGAGMEAGHTDAAYEEAGARVGSADDANGADIVLRVAVPGGEEIGRLRSGQILIGHLAPLTSADTTKALRDASVTSFAMEAIPRITRAQAMAALSSQAIATAKRLGAIVTGFDVRKAAWEQIASLGGKPIELDFLEDLEDEHGYARPPTDEENVKIREALAEVAPRQNVIITTAQIPGRPAPLLITADAVAAMAPGSVIVDLAGDSGGNCELTKGGETVVSDNGVKIIAPTDLPSHMASDSSQLYAKNLENLIDLLIGEDGNLNLNFEDEVIAGACITHGGEIKHERAKAVAEG